MKIREKDVQHVAHLSRLILSEEELKTMTGQLDTILSYVDKLAELDTAGVKPTSHVFSVANGPQQDGETFQVPRIL